MYTRIGLGAMRHFHFSLASYRVFVIQICSFIFVLLKCCIFCATITELKLTDLCVFFLSISLLDIHVLCRWLIIMCLNFGCAGNSNCASQHGSYLMSLDGIESNRNRSNELSNDLTLLSSIDHLLTCFPFGAGHDLRGHSILSMKMDFD